MSRELSAGSRGSGYMIHGSDVVPIRSSLSESMKPGRRAKKAGSRGKNFLVCYLLAVVSLTHIVVLLC